MTQPPAPPPGTLLPFLEDLINRYLARRPLRRTLSVPILGALEVGPESVRLEAEGVEIAMSYQGGSTLPKGHLNLRLSVVRSTPEETELAFDQAPLGMLAKLGGAGLIGKMLVGPLQKYFGEGVRLEGVNLVLVHAPVLAKVLGRG
ncbi:MAG: hypothetical protein OEW39_08850 [Deltaproteobacteria bacterium]|nr:hypothetical protein [Deltaproteobacteria bacterium]